MTNNEDFCGKYQRIKQLQIQTTFLNKIEDLENCIQHLKDENIAPKVKRVLDIWSERQIFNDKFLKELTAIFDQGK